MEKSEPPHLVAVFEAVNESRREFYVGTTTLPEGDLKDLARSVAFRGITHWGPDEAIVYRIVESALGLDEALRFIKNYAATIQRIGWKVFTE